MLFSEAIVEIRYLAGRLFRAQPLRLGLAVVTMAAAGLFEGVGVAAIAPMLQVMESGSQGSAPMGTAGGFLSQLLMRLGLPFALWSTLLFILAFIVGSQVLVLGGQKILAGSSALFEADLRRELFAAVIRARWPLFVRVKAGDVVSTVLVDTIRAGSAYQTFVQLLGMLVIIVVYATLAFALSWQLALATTVMSVVVLVFLRNRSARGTKYGQTLTVTDHEIYHTAQEEIAAAKLIKAYAAEPPVERGFNALNELRQVAMYKNSMNQAWLRFYYDAVSVSVVFAGLYLGVAYLGITSSTMIVFLFVFYRLSPRVSTAQSLYSQLLSLIPGLHAYDRFLADAAEMREESGTKDLDRIERGISLSNVSFSYDSETPLLQELNLEIPVGRSIAIVGPSGSGKTTVADLLMGLVIPLSGEVLVDGLPLGEISLAQWRQRVAYVPQDAAFFHASVRDNISWGSEDASDAEIVAAAEMAYADDFVTALPEGYDTIIGDRGVRLSGGQRQRLALARAIVRHPDVLILDEATSALDAESEGKIQRAVDSLSESMTIVTVTHRLAALKSSDFVYVMENGRLVESGTWDELIARRGRFYELRELQGLG